MNHRRLLTLYSQSENINIVSEKFVVHVISRKILRDFCLKHSDSCEALFSWYRVATKAEWQNLTEVQAQYLKAEAVGHFTVFNIKGNQYRLIVDINYATQRIYIKYILTHAEYDKDRWKNDPYF
jgi:mRNA interferase HigB